MIRSHSAVPYRDTERQSMTFNIVITAESFVAVLVVLRAFNVL